MAIVSGDARHTFRAEIADTAQARSQGLMYRRQLAPDAGMLFDFKHVGEVTMWMADTYIPLDMLFIRADGVIHRIEADTVPFSRQTIASRGPVLAVLEVPAGTARRLAIKPGDLVEHPIFSSDR